MAVCQLSQRRVGDNIGDKFTAQYHKNHSQFVNHLSSSVLRSLLFQGFYAHEVRTSQSFASKSVLNIKYISFQQGTFCGR